MSKRQRVLVAILVVVCVAVGSVLVGMAIDAQQEVKPAGSEVSDNGAEVLFDGRTVQIDPGHTFAIESIYETRVFSESTVTTSQVTITVWNIP